MPKKTKQQKKRSDQRKNNTLAIISENPIQIRTHHTKKPIQKSEDSTTTDTVHTVKDLKKTFIIAIGLFALEFLVFYAKLKSIL